MKLQDDKEMLNIIDNIPRLVQRQYSLNDQLIYLQIVANKLGLHDASDFLKYLKG
jgi:hypothetical protein